MSPRDSYWGAELIEKTEFATNLAVFKFLANESLPFISGQYATIAVVNGAEILERPYSIVSSPQEPLLEFFIERVPDGLLTSRLWELHPGDEILIRKRAVGRLTLNHKMFSRHLMIATVTGIAPFVSIIRTKRLERNGRGSVDDRFLVIHGASYSNQFGPYLNELSELAREGWVSYIPTISRPKEEPIWRGEVGRVEDVVRKYLDRLGFDQLHAFAYVCGQPAMVENVQGVLTRARFNSQQIRTEDYFAAEVPDDTSAIALA